MDAHVLHPGFSKAVEFFGSQAELARALGVTPQYVNECRISGFSARSALQLERVTGGAIKALDVVRERETA